MRLPIRAALFLIALTLLSACSILQQVSDLVMPSQSPPPLPDQLKPTPLDTPEPTVTTVPVEQLTPVPSVRTTDVEIVWLVPDETLDGYLIRYGFNRDALEYEVRLKWTDLEVREDPQNGRVFVHSLSAIPADQAVFFTITGIKDGQLSQPTSVIEVSG